MLLTGGGLDWLVPGVLLCMLVAVLDAWVLLIEIARCGAGQTVRLG